MLLDCDYRLLVELCVTPHYRLLKYCSFSHWQLVKARDIFCMFILKTFWFVENVVRILLSHCYSLPRLLSLDWLPSLVADDGDGVLVQLLFQPSLCVLNPVDAYKAAM